MKKKEYNTKTFEQIAREKLKMKDKEVYKELVTKMIIPYFFTTENLKKFQN